MLDSLRLADGRDQTQLVAVLDEGCCLREDQLEIARDVGNSGSSAMLDVSDRAAEPGRMKIDVEQGCTGGRVDVLNVRAQWDELAHDLIGRPRYRGNDVDTQLVVDHRARGIIDAGDDALDAKSLPHHSGCDDVGIVPGGDGGESGCLLDTGLPQRIAVKADSGNLLALEIIR